MKKMLFLLASAILVLTACGETNEQPKEVSKVESEGSQTESNDSNEAEVEEEEEVTDYNQVLLDSDNAVVTLESITKVEDKTFDEEYYSIKLSIDNKLEETIEVQAQEVSADDVMVDDMVFFSETIAGGKKANAEMKIQNYEGDLPSLDESLEFKLMVLNESWDTVDEPLVKIEIK